MMWIDCATMLAVPHSVNGVAQTSSQGQGVKRVCRTRGQERTACRAEFRIVLWDVSERPTERAMPRVALQRRPFPVLESLCFLPIPARV